MLNRRAMLRAAAVGTAVSLVPSGIAVAGRRTDVKAIVDGALADATGFPGLVIGAIAGRDEYVAGTGATGRTIFQLGSVTKTFTALLLARAVEAGLVRLDDPLQRYLPPGLVLPDETITLRHVATQSSGLPSITPNITTDPDFDPADPYAHYSDREFAEGLRATELRSEPGAEYFYSNLGFALLGKAMTHLARTSYPHAVRRFATAPLGLHDTTVALTPWQRARKTTGHAADGTPVPDWHLPTFAGAGALYGTADDTVRYLRALLGAGPLQPALRLVQQPLFTPPNQPGLRLGLAWHRTELASSERTLVWHNGITGGYHSFAGFNPASHTAVVVLANIAKGDEVDLMGLRLADALDRA